MGARGPVPKRDIERRRRNKPAKPTTTIPATGEVRVPQASSGWCRRARALWREAKKSPMAQCYEGTDWQMLAYLCDLMTTLFRPGRLSLPLERAIREAASAEGLTKDERLYLEWMLAPVRPSAQLVASMNSVLTTLGLTEGDRRRMGVEIERGSEKKPAGVLDMDDYRRARQG